MRVALGRSLSRGEDNGTCSDYNKKYFLIALGKEVKSHFNCKTWWLRKHGFWPTIRNYC